MYCSFSGTSDIDADITNVMIVLDINYNVVHMCFTSMNDIRFVMTFTDRVKKMITFKNTFYLI